MPVLTTLKGLIESGDKVIAIEGILSGTLSYIFNSWKAGEPFSDVVMKAKELGYTEPDPREDLSGMDVARKVCARLQDRLLVQLLAHMSKATHGLVPPARVHYIPALSPQGRRAAAHRSATLFR